MLSNARSCAVSAYADETASLEAAPRIADARLRVRNALLFAGASASALVSVPSWANPSTAANTPNFSQTTAGAVTQTVPDGVCAVAASVQGGAGGSSGTTAALGGIGAGGARISARFNVLAGQAVSGTVASGGRLGTLNATAANNGTGAANGGSGGTVGIATIHRGAGGGGSTALLVGGVKMIEAGGGGGGGAAHQAAPTGNGGGGGFAGIGAGVVAVGVNGNIGSPAQTGGGQGGQSAAGGAGGLTTNTTGHNGFAGLGIGTGTGGNGGAPGAAGARGKRRDSGSGTVYVLADGQIKPVAVNLGITDNRNTEVTGGDLKAGDRVVLSENLPNVEPASGTGVRMRMF